MTGDGIKKTLPIFEKATLDLTWEQTSEKGDFFLDKKEGRSKVDACLK